MSVGTRIRFAFLAVASTALFGCALSSPGVRAPDLSDLERTWANAVVVLPPLGSMATLRTTMESADMAAWLRRMPIGEKVPVVVYSHGCTGVGNLGLLEHLANAGFAVVAPDSFARRFRPLQCDPRTQTGGRNLFVYDFRLEEVAFALEQLWLRRWADWDRLYLVGASEGGVAAAIYRGDEFKGRVIAQWTCGGSPHVAGLMAPAGEPVIALVAADDPWYRSGGGHCGPLLQGRADSRSYVLDVPGQHELLEEPVVVQIVVDFLATQARRGFLATP